LNEKWIIIASGPSMAQIDMRVIRRFRSWRVMVVNNSWELAPWADVLYAGDLQWWDRYGDFVWFPGEKWTRDGHAALKYRLHLTRCEKGAGLCLQRGTVHAGGNSGYQAINLAYHFGARKIVLLGFDMHRDGGGHWHGEHAGMLSAPASHIAVWRRDFPALAADLQLAGCKVVNATPGTALDCFPKMDLVKALKC
jgi:hypothetical protein